MGTQAGKRHSVEDIVLNWIRRLRKISPQGLVWLEDKLNNELLFKLEKYKRMAGKNTQTVLNNFLRENRENIYTHEQLRRIIESELKGSKNLKCAKNNLIYQNKEFFILYDWSTISTEIQAIIAALEYFLDNDSQIQ